MYNVYIYICVRIERISIRAIRIQKFTFALKKIRYLFKHAVMQWY